MKKLLVIGVDRVVGANVATVLADRAQVCGTYEKCPIELVGCQSLPCPLDHSPTVAALVRDLQPDWMLYCGPLADASWSASRVDASREPAVAAMLRDAAGRHGSRLAVISTEAVFNGPRLFHAEHSPQGSQAPCALAARAVEAALAGSGGLIVRTHAYGWAPPGAAPDFAEAAFEALQTGQPLAVDSHRYATPLLASDLAELLWKAMAADLAGVIHLAGAERTSLRRFVHVLAAELSITPVACHEACGEQLQPAATETSLVAILARDRLKTPMPTLREGLGRFVRQRYDGYYDKLHAGSRAHAHAA